ncbi:zinc transporter 1 isoform X2 [Thrips palmi]|uniref:Zinc transporter 1 isoform X2 n=1 Tax=Thrips palmi TaxID=161013 RepID=A0A6P8ZZ93_THRPL|nr:zinc transporter 1 isoform X2 [Thrips palmi]
MKLMVSVSAAMPLYVMLSLTAALFMVQLALSHVTHALTLLVDSYHMLCNLIALSGCIITIKKGIGGGSPPIRRARDNSAEDVSTENSMLRDGARPSAADRRLRNTFGWARIDVLVSLIGSVFLASLCFSLVVEAVQTLLHIDHHDEMHEPLYVAGAGVASLAVNALCYILLGGYTFHQGSFFHVTETGDVMLEPAVTQDSVKLGERRLSSQRRLPARSGRQPRQRQGCREMLRDTVGCVMVIIASLTVFFTDKSVAKYADPLMSIVSAILLLWLSYPYMKEAGLILLQTIPEHINIDELRSDFQQAFPGTASIHDLHVWRLNQSKVFCTAHVRFRHPRDYLRVNQDVSSFFLKYGVTQVTVQPEFLSEVQGADSQACLMRCPGESCLRAHCCAPSAHDAHHKHYVRVASDLSLPEQVPAAVPAAPPAAVVPARAADKVQVVVEVNAAPVQETSFSAEAEATAATAPSTPTPAQREEASEQEDKSKQD